MVEQVQQQRFQQHQQHVRRQEQVAEEQPKQAGNKARRDKLIGQIQSSCGQAQLGYLDNSLSLLSAQVHQLKQNVVLSLPHAVEDIGRIKATFARRGIAPAIPPDYFELSKFGV